MNSAPPPKPAPKPGKIRVFKAIYPYTAQQQDELCFDEGDTLYVSDSFQDEGWWTATCNGKTGLIPSNYISEFTEAIEFPLHEAAKRGNMEFFRECLQNKVSVNSLDKSGSTALYWATHSGFENLVDILLAIPTLNLNAQNKIGDTAVHAAAWKGHSSILEKLIEKGAKFNLKNHEGKRPRDLAKNAQVAAFLQRLEQSASLDDVHDDYSGDDSD